MSASKLIDKQIAELADWRGKMIAELRKIIHDADPEIATEWILSSENCHRGLLMCPKVANGWYDDILVS